MLPLRSYHREWLIVALIAAAALAVANTPSPAVSRIGLANSLLEGRLTIDDYGRQTVDRARYEGRYYLDKAPGISVVAAVPVAVINAVDPELTDADNKRFWDPEGSFLLWAVRALVGGVFFTLGVVLVGRVAEGFVAGTGAIAAVAYGLGTLAHPLGPTLFGHVPAGTLGLAALILASRRGSTRLVAAGLCAGSAVLLEYQAALIVVALLIYVELRHGLRAALLLAAGGLPAAVLLALYNVAAFGSPLRFSYEFVDNVYADRQREGLFGIGMPDAGSLATVLVGARGLLLLSPVVLVAAAGLWLLGRRGYPLEALAVGAVSVAFLLLNAGYFLPYGGVSPGPRFLAPCLPLLALGLGPAFARWPRVTLAATAYSVVAMTMVSLTWAFAPEEGALWPSAETLAKTIWMAVAGDRIEGAVFTGAVALAALAVACAMTRSRDCRNHRPDLQ